MSLARSNDSRADSAHGFAKKIPVRGGQRNPWRGELVPHLTAVRGSQIASVMLHLRLPLAALPLCPVRLLTIAMRRGSAGRRICHLFSGDDHAPCLDNGSQTEVEKAVVKIRERPRPNDRRSKNLVSNYLQSSSQGA
jgi:hypothetical protein